MVVKGLTPGPSLPHVGPESIFIFTVKTPMRSIKRKEVLKKCFIFYETLPVPGEICHHSRKWGGGFFPKMSVWFSWLRPLKMLGIMSLVQYMSKPLLYLGNLCLSKSLEKSKTMRELFPLKMAMWGRRRQPTSPSSLQQLLRGPSFSYTCVI